MTTVQHKPFAITLKVGSSLANKTGSWRTFRPVYLDRMPPCNHQCPAGENIQAWLFHAEEGNYEQAWRQIMADNPFPAIMGRVCYHTCESACNRGQVDQAVGINAVERFLGDQALKYGWAIEPGKPTGKRVLVVGAGPAGLSAAYHLARLGHAVTVLEASPKAGGMIRYGIPKYRMPREKLNAEIQRIQAMGVEIRLNTRVTDLQRTLAEGGFDACFLALGLQLGQQLAIPQTGGLPVLDAIGVLRAVELEEPVALHGHVVVNGGGNTAIDVARSAIRLGALSVTVVVRRGREFMPAHPSEIREGLEEGMRLLNLRQITAIQDRTLTLEVMVPVEGGQIIRSGQTEILEADVLVQAFGQSGDFAAFEQLPGLVIADGAVQVGPDLMTGAAGIFAGGDMIPWARNATAAIGLGKKAARHIDAWLRGQAYRPRPKAEVADIGKLNTWYYSDAPRTVRPLLDVVRRTSGFAEVVGNLDEGNALFEARRCMSCGNCFECDNCYGVCPDNAVIKLGPGKRFRFNYDYCKGCGICAAECPCGAIKMVPEEI
ncbi:MAG: FAD-dependent oxidoreductase [Gammaproteobacteria bacterium]|jgi:2-oxoacid:acceptor oxidoreductase delta subunit (pyruvate/2-ketoisovalerate family)|nr:FAD-dependent oxidoreductase [Gammaproteobacteria bacterium]